MIAIVFVLSVEASYCNSLYILVYEMHASAHVSFFVIIFIIPFVVLPLSRLPFSLFSVTSLIKRSPRNIRSNYLFCICLATINKYIFSSTLCRAVYIVALSVQHLISSLPKTIFQVFFLAF